MRCGDRRTPAGGIEAPRCRSTGRIGGGCAASASPSFPWSSLCGLIEPIGFPIVTAAFVAADSWYLGRYRSWARSSWGAGHRRGRVLRVHGVPGARRSRSAARIPPLTDEPPASLESASPTLGATGASRTEVDSEGLTHALFVGPALPGVRDGADPLQHFLRLRRLLDRHPGRRAPGHRADLGDRHPPAPHHRPAAHPGHHHDGGDLLRGHVRGLDDRHRGEHSGGGGLRAHGPGRLRAGQAGACGSSPGHRGHRLLRGGNAQPGRRDLLRPHPGGRGAGLRSARVLRPHVHGALPGGEPLGEGAPQGAGRDVAGPPRQPDRHGPVHRDHPPHLRLLDADRRRQLHRRGHRPLRLRRGLRERGESRSPTSTTPRSRTGCRPGRISGRPGSP